MATEKAYRIVGPKDPSDATSYVILPGGQTVEVGSEFVGTQEQYEAVSVLFVVEEVGAADQPVHVDAPVIEIPEKGGDK